MKIYSRSNLVAGLLGLVTLVLFGFGVMEASWWKWLITIAFTARFMYTGLSKSGSEREKHITTHYEEAALALHGKHHAVKTSLPWIVVGGFFVLLFVLLLFDFWLPEWVLCVCLVVMMGAGVYSLLVYQSIREYIDEHFPQEEEPDA